MRDLLLNLWIRFRHNDEGVTLVEYGVAVAFAIAAGGIVVATLKPEFQDAMTAAGAAMP